MPTFYAVLCRRKSPLWLQSMAKIWSIWPYFDAIATSEAICRPGARGACRYNNKNTRKLCRKPRNGLKVTEFEDEKVTFFEVIEAVEAAPEKTATNLTVWT